MPTVTVRTAPRRRFILVFSKLPDSTFGPYDFANAISELRIAAFLEPLAARNLVMDAAVTGSAVSEIPAI